MFCSTIITGEFSWWVEIFPEENNFLSLIQNRKQKQINSSYPCHDSSVMVLV